MKKGFLALGLICGVSLSLVACGTKDEQSGNATIKEATNQKNSTQQEGHIDYDKQEDWAFTSGKMQSPIDISTKNLEEQKGDTGKISVNYDTEVTKVENNGHSIQVSDGGTAEIDGRMFNLSQFHFHAESEHTVDGQHFPIEVHFVNVGQDGRLAVIGVFFKEGNENKGFQEVLDDVSSETNEPITSINQMIPENKSYYHYLGSLTTPPLTENVEWYVLSEPVEVSSKQIETFKKLYSHNNRETQPLNERAVVVNNQ